MMMFTDLPQELEWEILFRVPATSLTQLRSTCRRWYALFKDPIFIKKNLGKAARQFIFMKDGGVYSVSINSFDPSIEFTGKLTTLKDSEQVVISTIYQCDGLLLYTTKDDNRLVVWNPCTGQTRWIQPSNRKTMYDKIVLGYENTNKSCRSYKILRHSEHYNKFLDLHVDEFEIFDFNSDSWRVLDGINYIWFIRSRGVSLKGDTYWVAWEKRKPFTDKILLRFDFKKERFESLSLPFQCDYFNGERLSLSVVREEKLAVLLETFSIDSLEMKIWVTDTKTKYINNIQYFLVDISNAIVGRLNFVESFLVDEEKKKVVCCRRDEEDEDRTIFYIVGGGGDHNIHTFKQVHGEIAQGKYDYWHLSDDFWTYARPDNYSDLLVSYVPSLVQVQQVKAKEKGD